MPSNGSNKIRQWAFNQAYKGGEGEGENLGRIQTSLDVRDIVKRGVTQRQDFSYSS